MKLTKSSNLKWMVGLLEASLAAFGEIHEELADELELEGVQYFLIEGPLFLVDQDLHD